MAIADRRTRERLAQRRLIIDTARALAEREGWSAMTTRRLATEIEYSQPVIYKHFASLDDLADAVALEGFAELAGALQESRGIARVARAYVDFALRNPALYDAMFSRSTGLRFGGEGGAAPLGEAFAALRSAVGTDGDDADARAEVVWSALHGLVTLTRSGRLREGHEAERLDLLVGALLPR